MDESGRQLCYSPGCNKKGERVEAEREKVRHRGIGDESRARAL